MKKLWRATLLVPPAAAPAAEHALAERAVALSTFEPDAPALVRIDAYFDREIASDELSALLGAASDGAGRVVSIEALAAEDWVSLSQAGHPPVRAGRFFVHGSHETAPPPAGSIPLRVDAGLAFGTGLHESTRGCLVALDWLGRRLEPRAMLDLGCGSGVLAMAMARLWRRPVLAVDIDPVACEVAKANARANGLGPLVRVRRADGPSDRTLRAAAPFDLVVANILAEPLRKMASALDRSVGGRGVIVLGGFLADQEKALAAAYRGRRFEPMLRIALGTWVTLALRRRAR